MSGLQKHISEQSNFFDFVAYIKPEIKRSIEQHIYVLGNEVLDTLAIPKETMCNLLITYMTNGKLWRASLYIYMLFSYVGKERFEHAYKDYLDIAVSLEFLQAFLLIHDDVMDDDDTRRNIPSMHKSFRSILQSLYVSVNDKSSMNDEQIKRGGESLAICLGDILYAYVFKIIGDHKAGARLFKVYATYIMKVGVGQFNDVYWSHIQTHFSQESASMQTGATQMLAHISSDDILQMYTAKTGAYTFSLPFILAALCADTIMPNSIDLQKEIQQLDILGNTMGVLFQIQDDIMGAYYDESITGKPKGSDFIEKKHTYIFSLLIDVLSHNEDTRQDYDLLSEIFQNTIGDEEVNMILLLMEKYDIVKKVETLRLQYTKAAYEYIDVLQVKQHKAYLKEFTAFLNTRER